MTPLGSLNHWEHPIWVKGSKSAIPVGFLLQLWGFYALPPGKRLEGAAWRGWCKGVGQSPLCRGHGGYSIPAVTQLMARQRRAQGQCQVYIGLV